MIDKTIPPHNEPEWILPYQAMEVGDSFFMPTMKISYAHYMVDCTSKSMGVRVKCFTTIEDGVLVERVWRLA